MQPSIRASAPGSLMLLGEYAVLYGKPALVCAIDQRITVTLVPRSDATIHLHSDLHGEYTTTVAEITIVKPFQFVLGVLQHYQTRLKRGCDLHIQSTFSDQVGLGSSAAVTAATIAAVVTWLDMRLTPLELVREGRRIIRAVQGVGSGADMAASVYGGIVHYQPQPLMVEKLNHLYPLTAQYAGFKTPTVTAIQQVQTQFAAYPALFRSLCNSIGQCVEAGIQHVRHQQWQSLGTLFNLQHALMDALGVNLPVLQEMVVGLRQQKNIIGAKISGSGLGDCVIALGEATGVGLFPVAMTLQGVHCEKI